MDYPKRPLIYSIIYILRNIVVPESLHWIIIFNKLVPLFLTYHTPPHQKIFSVKLFLNLDILFSDKKVIGL